MPEVDLYPALGEKLSDEQKLIIMCSHKEISENQKKEATSFVGSWNPDWDLLLKLANDCKVTPLVYKSLQTFSVDIPEAVKTRLREKTGSVFARNIRYTDFIKHLADLFSEEGIDVLFLKGAALMSEVYEGPGLRMFSDIDVLVKEGDISRVDELLKKNGLKEIDKTDKWDKYRSQRVYITKNKLSLDVHVDFIGRRLHNKLLKIDKEAIWKNKKTVSIDGTSISTMDLVHTLLYQCLHLAVQHSFWGLSGYVDINEIVNKWGKQIDWDEVLKLSAKYRIKRPVYYSLLFTKNLLGSSIPEEVLAVLSRVRRRSDKWVFKKIKAHNRAGDYLAELVLFDTWGETIKFTVLSFVTYPHLFTHFFRIFGRVIKEIFTPSERKEA